MVHSSRFRHYKSKLSSSRGYSLWFTVHDSDIINQNSVRTDVTIHRFTIHSSQFMVQDSDIINQC